MNNKEILTCEDTPIKYYVILKTNCYEDDDYKLENIVFLSSNKEETEVKHKELSYKQDSINNKHTKGYEIQNKIIKELSTFGWEERTKFNYSDNQTANVWAGSMSALDKKLQEISRSKELDLHIMKWKHQFAKNAINTLSKDDLECLTIFMRDQRETIKYEIKELDIEYPKNFIITEIDKDQIINKILGI